MSIKRKMCFAIGCCILVSINISGATAFTILSIGAPMSSNAIINDPGKKLETPGSSDRGFLVLQVGYGFQSNVNIAARVTELNQLDITTFVPPLTMKLDINVSNSLSMGVSAGASIWQTPILNYKYRYLVGSIHTAYHFSIASFIDPYMSGALSYKRIGIPNENQTLSRWIVTSNIVAGVRVFFSKRIGAFAEIGNDAMTHHKAGIAFCIG